MSSASKNERPLQLGPPGNGAHRISTLGKRIAQLQCLALYSVGDQSQIRSIGEDAASVGTPSLGSRLDERQDANLLSADILDYFTWDALRTHGGGTDWRPGEPPRRRDRDVLLAQTAETGAAYTALLLMNHSLGSRSVLERVVAAQCVDVLTRGQSWRAADILADAQSSASVEVAAIAAAGWSNTNTPDRMPQAGRGRGEAPWPLSSATPDGSVHSLAIHGTWARVAKQRWYSPSHALHRHIRDSVTPGLYSGEDYPRWSGGYSDADRETGAQGLIRWVQARRLSFLTGVDTVFAHSHGGNVALSAIGMGMQVELLVLLHVPPRWRADEEWARIRSNVRRILVYRSRLDRVVLADMLSSSRFSDRKRAFGQQFDQAHLPHTDTDPHPIRGPWFDHGFFTNVDKWRELGVANDVRYWRHQTAGVPSSSEPAYPPPVDTLSW